MANISLFDKIKILINTIISNPFFSFSAIFGLILAILMIVDIIKHKKIRKRFYVIAWFFITIFIVAKYFKIIPTLVDNLVNQLFMTLYFPSMGIYMFIIIFINASFIYCLFKNVNKFFKIITGIISIFLDLFFVLIINIVLEKNIDVNMEISLYTNSKLLVLLELSTALFVSWILLMVFVSAYLKLQKFDNNLVFDQNYSFPKMDIYVDEDNKVYKRKVIPSFYNGDKDS